MTQGSTPCTRRGRGESLALSVSHSPPPKECVVFGPGGVPSGGQSGGRLGVPNDGPGAIPRKGGLAHRRPAVGVYPAVIFGIFLNWLIAVVALGDCCVGHRATGLELLPRSPLTMLKLECS